MIGEEYGKFLYLNCDEPDIRHALSGKTSSELLRFIGDTPLVIVDEAQRVENIGLTLKLIIDSAPHIQLLVTGSSAFDLANTITEPLTGRKYEYYLYPFSLSEIKAQKGTLEANRMIDDLLVYGSYPLVLSQAHERETHLKELAGSYLFHDILTYESLRRPELLEKILKALALQIGSEVSYTEIANLIGTDKNTVTRYIELLEKTFVIFRLGSFARNLRNELKRSQKIYFTDRSVYILLTFFFRLSGVSESSMALPRDLLAFALPSTPVSLPTFPTYAFGRGKISAPHCLFIILAILLASSI